MAKRKANWPNSIAHWRKMRKMSQEALGAALPGGKTSKGTISAIESGTSQASVSMLHEIAKALDVPTAALLETPPTAEIIYLWSRIPAGNRELAKDVLARFAE